MFSHVKKNAFLKIHFFTCFFGIFNSSYYSPSVAQLALITISFASWSFAWSPANPESSSKWGWIWRAETIASHLASNYKDSNHGLAQFSNELCTSTSTVTSWRKFWRSQEGRCECSGKGEGSSTFEVFVWPASYSCFFGSFQKACPTWSFVNVSSSGTGRNSVGVIFFQFLLRRFPWKWIGLSKKVRVRKVVKMRKERAKGKRWQEQV